MIFYLFKMYFKANDHKLCSTSKAEWESTLQCDFVVRAAYRNSEKGHCTVNVRQPLNKC